jgi:hypothetical protein
MALNNAEVLILSVRLDDIVIDPDWRKALF